MLCHSIAGNPVPLLTITASTKSPDENQAKRAVVLTSRVHPGETNGSWMMKGLLDFLTGDSADAKVGGVLNVGKGYDCTCSLIIGLCY